MASIVMLAFVVFPHHHHNEYICFATAHCQDEGENEEHSHDTGSSNHRCKKSFSNPNQPGTKCEHQSEEGAYHHFSLSLFLVSNILEFLSSEAEQQCDSDSYYQGKNFIQPVIYRAFGWPSPSFYSIVSKYQGDTLLINRTEFYRTDKSFSS